MAEDTASPERAKVPLIDQLVEQTHKRFLSLDALDGKGQPNLLENVAEDIVKESGINPLELFTTLQKQTSVSPEDLLNHNDELFDADTWDNFFQQTSTTILYCEVKKRFPEVQEEDAKRLEKFDEKD